MGVRISPRGVNCSHLLIHVGDRLVKMAGRLTSMNSPCGDFNGYSAVCQIGLSV